MDRLLEQAKKLLGKCYKRSADPKLCSEIDEWMEEADVHNS